MGFDRVPAPAFWLGAAGLVPFVATTLGIWATADPRWAAFLFFVQLLYAAVIVSFLGAVHWGLAMANLGWAGQRTAAPDRLNDGGDATPRAEPAVRQFLYSVAPALVAWAVVLVSQILSAGWVEVMLMMVLFAAAYRADRSAVRFGLAPDWYLDLRWPLTLAVELMLGLTLLRLA